MIFFIAGRGGVGTDTGAGGTGTEKTFEAGGMTRGAGSGIGDGGGGAENLGAGRGGNGGGTMTSSLIIIFSGGRGAAFSAGGKGRSDFAFCFRENKFLNQAANDCQNDRRLAGWRDSSA